MVRCDTTFLGAYGFEAAELPGGRSSRVFWYPGASRRGGRDGVVLEVTPRTGDRWFGIFAASQVGLSDAVSVAVALPDRRNLAVVSSGAAYRVSAADPIDWEELALGIVAELLVVEDRELVLFFDSCEIVALGVNGIAWRTDRLVWDGLRVLRVDSDVVEVEGFDAPGRRTARFSVDLRSGRAPGAPYPGALWSQSP